MQKKDTLKRYILFQIPELLITIFALIIIRYFFIFPLWIVFVVVAGAIIKDIILFHYTWTAYITHNADDYINIIGKLCVAVENFEKKGLVRLNGELWKATSDKPVQKDEVLIIIKITGLELFVKKVS